MSKSLTPTGMAANDVPDFTNKVNAWRDYVTKNRNVLNNPRDKNYGNTLNQEQYLYNDALSHSEGSKSKVKQLDEANKLRLSHPEYGVTDMGMSEISRAGSPISKGGGNLDWSKIAYDPKEAKETPLIDKLKKWNDYVWTDLKMDETGTRYEIDPKTHSKVAFTTSKYSPEAIQTVHDRAALLYNKDPDFHRTVNDLIESGDQAQFNELNQKFKDAFGHDLDIKHPEEFGAAMLLKPTSSQAIQNQGFTPAVNHITINNQAQQSQFSVDNYMSQLINSAQKQGFKPAGGQWEERLMIQPSPELSEMFAVKSGNYTYYPDQIQYNPKTKEWSSVFYEVDPTTKTPKIDNSGHATIDKSLTQKYSNDAVRVRMADKFLGQKATGTLMGQPSQTVPKPKPKSNKKGILD